MMMLYGHTYVDLSHGNDLAATSALVDNRKYLIGRSRVYVADSDELLYELLQQLGVRTDTTAIRCFQHVPGATARAAANIADWMTYLPKSCVTALVNDGWHWST